MKNIIACGLVLALMVCAVPAGALSPIAFDDNMTLLNGGCTMENVFTIGNVLENDLIFDTPVTIEIIQQPENGHAEIIQKTINNHWRAGDLIYYFSPEYPPAGPEYLELIDDSLQYRLHDPQTGEYSDPATVYIDQVRYITIPDRTLLHTPEDTELIFDGFGHSEEEGRGCFSGHTGWSAEITDGPDHGTITFGFGYEEEAPGTGPLHYLPDAGFTGWDHLTYICRTEEKSEYGDCFSQQSELWISVGSEPYPSPEFPSALLPVILLAGVLGSVLLINRTREK